MMICWLTVAGASARPAFAEKFNLQQEMKKKAENGAVRFNIKVRLRLFV